MYQIKAQAHKMLPRERLLVEGAERLSNQELLAILLRTGTKTSPVMEMANKVLSQLTNLTDFQDYSVQELQQLEGIGKVKSIEIKAMLELAKRIHKADLGRTESIWSSESLGKKMIVEIGGHKQEHLIALYLDTQNRIIEQRTVFIGTVQRSIAEPREILYYACKNMATSIILVHNHPSGSLVPSHMDEMFTKQIKQSCDCIGIVCLDHLIVTREGYFSFRADTDLLTTH